MMMMSAHMVRFHGEGKRSTRASEVTIRAYNEILDCRIVDELEKKWEAGLSLYTDLLGDPLGRVRRYPIYSMLVAEMDFPHNQRRIVGMIRAGIKEVICGPNPRLGKTRPPPPDGAQVGGQQHSPGFKTVAYILGLRIDPEFRRLGIGATLVQRMEEWCKQKGAEYAYMATEKGNEACLNLFTNKLGYAKFRTPAILVQPIYARRKKLPPNVEILQLSKDNAEALYRDVFKEKEFFPKDVGKIMRSNLHKGTWMAKWRHIPSKEDKGKPCEPSPPSWAVMSLWKCNEIFRLQVKGAPLKLRTLVRASRFAGKIAKVVCKATLPIPPNVFKPFGLQLMYGLHAQGPRAHELLASLSWLAHNMAKQDGCSILATELGSCDPLGHSIPHWPSLSCDEDLWCLKHLATNNCSDDVNEWCKSPPPLSLFVDPRDF